MVVMLPPATALTGSEQERVPAAVDVHRAGAALGDAAAVFGAHEAEHVPQHPKQRRVGIDVDVVGRPLTVRRTIPLLPSL